MCLWAAVLDTVEKYVFFFIIILFKGQKIEEEERRNKRLGIVVVDCDTDHFILGNSLS